MTDFFQKTLPKFCIIALFLLFAFFSFSVAKSPDEGRVTLYFFDVGQGDSALIQQNNYQILIDGGPDDKVLNELGKAMPLGDRKIEMVILSHPHADHITGLNLVLDRYEIGEIYFSGVRDKNNQYFEFLNKIKQSNLKSYIPEINSKISPFSNGNLTFLWPGKLYQNKEISNPNNASEIVKFCYFENCALFTGDIESDSQNEMLANNLHINSAILKVPHHGAENGANNNLYEKVIPIYSIFSVGTDNKYGHPHNSALNLAAKHNSEILRTDDIGTIQFSFSEKEIKRIK